MDGEETAIVALVAAETVVLLLLSLLVAGLLRSHAEILRRLPPQRAGGQSGRLGLARGGDVSLAEGRKATSAPTIQGVPLNGGSDTVEFPRGGPSTLLAFLSSGCGSCHTFWAALSSRKRDRLLREVRLVIVTEAPESESLARLKKLAPRKVSVVMSAQAWRDYEVPGAPYFVYVDGSSAEVRGEGAAGDWSQLRRLVEDALADAELAEASANGGHAARDPRLSDSHPERIREADRALLEAGVGPDHPSLWPGGKPPDADDPAADQR